MSSLKQYLRHLHQVVINSVMINYLVINGTWSDWLRCGYQHCRELGWHSYHQQRGIPPSLRVLLSNVGSKAPVQASFFLGPYRYGCISSVNTSLHLLQGELTMTNHLSWHLELVDQNLGPTLQQWISGRTKDKSHLKPNLLSDIEPVSWCICSLLTFTSISKTFLVRHLYYLRGVLWRCRASI